MRLMFARRCRGRPHEYATVLHLHFVTGNGVILRTRFADASDAMEFPIVPGAHHIIAVQLALTERAAGVIAHAGDDAEDAIAMREGELGATEVDFGQRTGSKIRCCSDILPVCVSHDVIECRATAAVQQVNKSVSAA